VSHIPGDEVLSRIFSLNNRIMKDYICKYLRSGNTPDVCSRRSILTPFILSAKFTGVLSILCSDFTVERWSWTFLLLLWVIGLPNPVWDVDSLLRVIEHLLYHLLRSSMSVKNLYRCRSVDLCPERASCIDRVNTGIESRGKKEVCPAVIATYTRIDKFFWK